MAITSIEEAKSRIGQYATSKATTLPQELYDDLIVSLGKVNSAECIFGATETIYRHRGAIDDDGRALCADLASFMIGYGWFGVTKDSHAHRITLAMRRDSGEVAPAGLEWPEPETDPETSPFFRSVIPVRPGPPPVEA